MSEKEYALSLEATQEIVAYLLSLGTRDGIIHADTLNKALGASARRRAETVRQEQYEAELRAEVATLKEKQERFPTVYKQRRIEELERRLERMTS